MTKLIVPFGGEVETIIGPAGVGDLCVTVQGGRNGLLGKLLGEDMTVKEAMEETKDQTIEGYPTTKGIGRLVKELEKKAKLNIKRDLPLFSQLYAVLYKGKPAQKAIKDYWRVDRDNICVTS
jgi:glycerol-3-phosphate dehydrogenase (NAD(P)+)